MRPYVSVVVVVCLFVCLFVGWLLLLMFFVCFLLLLFFCFFLASGKSRDQSRTFSDIIMAHILHG